VGRTAGARTRGASRADANVVIVTERLSLRHLTVDDAPFILRLVNEPSWLEFIGDKGVKSLDDARGYLTNGPIAMYARAGFGLYMTELNDSGTPIGMCGLIKRDSLPDVDIGFAFFPEHWGKGYAYEAASAVLKRAGGALSMRRVVAIVSPGNRRSIELIGRLGMVFEAELDLDGRGDKTLLFACNL
jgi:RimJ/RimL family protein N-acetyltransferase